MTSLLSNKEIKKNNLSQINHSNKNILLKKEENNNKNKEDIIYHKDLHEKIILRKNALLTNTSVKKIKQIKKISISDNENKAIKMKRNKKSDSPNKENKRINNKEKNEVKKVTKKKTLKNIVDSAKIRIKQNLPNKINKNINNKEIVKNKNKLSIFLNNSENIRKIETLKRKENERIINNQSLNKKKCIKKLKKKDNTRLLKSQNQSIIIKNDKNENVDPFEETLNSKDLEYTFKYERKHMSEQKIRVKEGESIVNIIPLMRMRREHIKYSIKKKRQNSNINIKQQKLVYEDDLNNSYLKKYNSINNEIENNRSYINIINNFDIINIINKKEETKKLSSSIQKNILNHTQELSKKRIKQNKSITNKNIIDTKIIKILGKPKENKKIIKKNKIKEKSYGPMTMRNTNSSINNIELLNTDKINNNNSFINNNILQNKWEKNYFIPIVSASLINGEEKLKEKNRYLKKLNTEKGSLENYLRKNKNKKSTNFGDNNKKKREMLFNFSNKKLKNENYSYIDFQSKRTNSFISKRNKHITERNNSINIMKNNNYDSNIDNDLNLQEKKLELIRNEISQEKIKLRMNKSNRCEISVDNLSDNSLDKHKMEEIIERQGNKDNNKKYKAYHVKLNSINLLKKSKKKDGRDSCDTIIIKRGDLLNRLRKIKHNYAIMENNNN